MCCVVSTISLYKSTIMIKLFLVDLSYPLKSLDTDRLEAFHQN